MPLNVKSLPQENRQLSASRALVSYYSAEFVAEWLRGDVESGRAGCIRASTAIGANVCQPLLAQ